MNDREHRAICADFAESFRNPDCLECQQLRGIQGWLPTRTSHAEYVKSPEYKHMLAMVTSASAVAEEFAAAYRAGFTPQQLAAAEQTMTELAARINASMSETSNE